MFTNYEATKSPTNSSSGSSQLRAVLASSWLLATGIAPLLLLCTLPACLNWLGAREKRFNLKAIICN